MASFKFMHFRSGNRKDIPKGSQRGHGKAIYGINIGETVTGDNFELAGYEFK